VFAREAGQLIDGVGECLRVQEQRGDVAEDDPRLREVGDVANVSPEVDD